LTPEQQEALIETGKEAGVYNNQVQAEADEYYKNLMIEEGVTVVEPTEEVLEGFREKAKAFYDEGATFGWSDGLYETVCAAMGK
ncbi:MAG: C4-dicarboxylate ABC transporter substrate-binding protein, partial [Clostridiales bacterium]|nr:C4-dicarboxylate ABC transporter substrate-binding protein [Clostridiales bacterium]